MFRDSGGGAICTRHLCFSDEEQEGNIFALSELIRKHCKLSASNLAQRREQSQAVFPGQFER